MRKKKKGKKSLSTGCSNVRDRGREKMKNKKIIQTYFFDLLSFVSQNSSDQERKSIYSTRATLGYQKKGISSRIQVRSFGNQRFRV